MVCPSTFFATLLGMLFVAPVRSYLCASRSSSIRLVKGCRPGAVSVKHLFPYSTISRTTKPTSVFDNSIRVNGLRMFGTVDSTTTDEVSKQQKLQDLINAYQTKGQVGTLDRSKFKSVLESLNSAQLSEPGNRKVFDDTMKFPADFMIKIVGQNEPAFVTDMLDTVKKCLDSNQQQNFPYSIKETAGGKYVSLTVTPVFQNAEELYATYEAIGKDKRVKMTL